MAPPERAVSHQIMMAQESAPEPAPTPPKEPETPMLSRALLSRKGGDADATLAKWPKAKAGFKLAGRLALAAAKLSLGVNKAGIDTALQPFGAVDEDAVKPMPETVRTSLLSSIEMAQPPQADSGPLPWKRECRVTHA